MLLDHMRKVKDSLEAKCEMVSFSSLSCFQSPVKRISTAAFAKTLTRTILKYSVDRLSTSRTHSTRSSSINLNSTSRSRRCANPLSFELLPKKTDRNQPKTRSLRRITSLQSERFRGLNQLFNPSIRRLLFKLLAQTSLHPISKTFTSLILMQSTTA